MYAHDRMLNMKNARNNNNNINIISALENSRYCVAYNNKKNNKMPIAFGQSWRVEEKSTWPLSNVLISIIPINCQLIPVKFRLNSCVL